jgi:hypothetical protein
VLIRDGRRISLLVLVAIGALFLLRVVWMQGTQGQGFLEPGADGGEAAVSAFTPNPQPTSPIDGVLERNGPRLLAIDGVIGIGHTRTAIGADAVLVHVLYDSVRERVPEEMEGYPVEVVVIKGGFDAQTARSF